jgi:chaperonin GroES
MESPYDNMSAGGAPENIRFPPVFYCARETSLYPQAIYTGVSANMKLRPLHDRIIVKRVEEERKTAGGIVIPDTATEKPSMGEVVAVGPGKSDDNGKVIAMGVNVGDKVLFGKYSGQEFKMDGHDYLHMREDDVIGIVG